MPYREGVSPQGSSVIVLYEDRPGSLTGLKLAALSLAKTSPGCLIHAIVPGASERFRSWATDRGIIVADVPESLRATGWDVKPSVLMHMLDTVADLVLWVDTDVIATQTIGRLLDQHPAETLVAAEEYYWGHHQGSTARTTTLGLDVGRVLPRSINSGVLRVARCHRRLLADWAEALATPEYAAAQATPIARRRVAYLGDQEVLGGLLGSRRYADLPLAQLRRGVDIAQCFGPSGFTVRERWGARHTLPTFVHAMGRKPWSRPPPASGALGARIGAAWENSHLDLTPYLEAAHPYLAELDEPADWANPVTAIGRLLSRAGSPALRELPLTLVDTTQRAVRRFVGFRQVPL